MPSGRSPASRGGYATILRTSEHVCWRLEDVVGGGKVLDFSLPFMPEGLAHSRLTFLTPSEQRALNQIRGHAYLYFFGLVEEFILPFAMDYAQEALAASRDYEGRALLQFAQEEAKHIQMFRMFREEFVEGFGTPCRVIGPPKRIADAVLNHSPLAVALATLHIEWMTQRHYLEAIKDDSGLDPQFRSLLRHHWIEEAQHVKLDALILEALAKRLTAQQIDEGIEGYARITAMLDAALEEQVRFDLEAFTRATGRKLDDSERSDFLAAQMRANRWTFLGSGMAHPKFMETIGWLSEDGVKAVHRMAASFC